MVKTKGKAEPNLQPAGILERIISIIEKTKKKLQSKKKMNRHVK